MTTTTNEAAPTKEQLAFQRDLAQHTAQLMDFARPYMGRLASSDRDFFLSQTLAHAWESRAEFVPDKENAGLLKWWEKCLKFAASCQLYWRVSRFDGTYHMVLGRTLGREG